MVDRWLLNLGLFLLVVLLGLAVYYLRTSEPQASAPALTKLKPDDIERARILFADGDEVRLQKQGQRWLLVSPVHARTNQAMTRNLLTLATANSILRWPASADNLKKYRLDAPTLTIWLNDAEISVGMEHAFKDARYVLHGNQIHLVSARHVAPAAYRYRNLLDRRLLEEDSQPVAIALPQHSLQLHNDKWEIQSPDVALTPDQINAFVDEWRFAYAFAVEPYSGRPVLDRISLRLQRQGTSEHETLELAILSHGPEFVLYRADEGLEYRFTEATGKRLLNIKSE
ncbi:MAG: hypothetical protein R3268_03055 [Acidiferrobacterales bacterium]|nr:hypothetical protein [Acidiferrobacterales bacterium]